MDNSFNLTMRKFFFKLFILKFYRMFLKIFISHDISGNIVNKKISLKCVYRFSLQDIIQHQSCF